MDKSVLFISKKDNIPKDYKDIAFQESDIENAKQLLHSQYKFDFIIISFSDYSLENIIDIAREAAENMTFAEVIVINGSNDTYAVRKLFREGISDYYTELESTPEYVIENIKKLTTRKTKANFIKDQNMLFTGIDYFIDKSPAGVILLDEEIVVQRVNASACKILKHEKKELVGKVFPSLPDKLINIFNTKDFSDINKKYIEGTHLYNDMINVFEYKYSAFPILFNNILKGMILMITKDKVKYLETEKRAFYDPRHRLDHNVVKVFTQMALTQGVKKIKCDIGSITIKNPISKQYELLAEINKEKINFPEKPVIVEKIEHIEHLIINGEHYFSNRLDSMQNTMTALYIPLIWDNDIIGSINFFWIKEQDIFSISEHIIKNIQSQCSYVMFLMTSNLAMQTEIKEKDSDLFLRAEKIKELNQEMSDFGTIISHDLKAPIRAIAQLAQWIRSDYYEKLDEQGVSMLDIMTKRLKRIDSLIEGIVTISKSSIEANKREIVNMNKAIKGALELVSPPSNYKISFPKDIPNIIASKTKIHQIVQNIISNAIKYNKNQNPSLDIWYEVDKEWFSFHFKDNGKGIPEKYHKKVFLIFQTLENKDENDSTGIGLAIVKKYIDRLNGQIIIDSKENEYTDFIIKLPTNLIVKEAED